MLRKMELNRIPTHMHSDWNGIMESDQTGMELNYHTINRNQESSVFTISSYVLYFPFLSCMIVTQTRCIRS